MTFSRTYASNSWFCKRTNFSTIRKSVFGILDGQNRQLPIASVQRTRSSLAGHSAILCGTTVSRMNANRAIGIAAQWTHCLERPMSVDQTVVWGRCECRWTLAIRIAAKTLASDSAITLALFRPSEVGICYMPTSSRFRCVMHPSWRLTATHASCIVSHLEFRAALGRWLEANLATNFWGLHASAALAWKITSNGQKFCETGSVSPFFLVKSSEKNTAFPPSSNTKSDRLRFLPRILPL